MDESERTVHAGAACGDVQVRRVCRQLVSDDVRYRFWLRRHEQPMSQVAASKYRREQIIHLRSTAVQHVHKTALVRYLSDFHITGKERDLTLAEFHGVTDPVQATLDRVALPILELPENFAKAAVLHNRLLPDQRSKADNRMLNPLPRNNAPVRQQTTTEIAMVDFGRRQIAHTRVNHRAHVIK